MGHLNAGFYGRIFDDAAAAAIQQLGYRQREHQAEGIGWADVRTEIEFHRELLADSIIAVATRVVRIGAKSITLEHRIHDESSNDLATTARTISVCFDLKARTSRELPEQIRRNALQLLAPSR